MPITSFEDYLFDQNTLPTCSFVAPNQCLFGQNAQMFTFQNDVLKQERIKFHVAGRDLWVLCGHSCAHRSSPHWSLLSVWTDRVNTALCDLFNRLLIWDCCLATQPVPHCPLQSVSTNRFEDLKIWYAQHLQEVVDGNETPKSQAPPTMLQTLYLKYCKQCKYKIEQTRIT